MNTTTTSQLNCGTTTVQKPQHHIRPYLPPRALIFHNTRIPKFISNKFKNQFKPKHHNIINHATMGFDVAVTGGNLEVTVSILSSLVSSLALFFGAFFIKQQLMQLETVIYINFL